MRSLTGVQISNEYIAESFGQQTFAPGEPNPNDWTPYTQLASTNGTPWYLSPDGTFSDWVGQAQRQNPTSLPPPPQPPLSTVLVDSGPQSWSIGSQQPSSGVLVQTNTFQRYLDHAAHTSIISPVPTVP